MFSLCFRHRICFKHVFLLGTVLWKREAHKRRMVMSALGAFDDKMSPLSCRITDQRLDCHRVVLINGQCSREEAASRVLFLQDTHFSRFPRHLSLRSFPADCIVPLKDTAQPQTTPQTQTTPQPQTTPPVPKWAYLIFKWAPGPSLCRQKTRKWKKTQLTCRGANS